MTHSDTVLELRAQALKEINDWIRAGRVGSPIIFPEEEETREITMPRETGWTLSLAFAAL